MVAWLIKYVLALAVVTVAYVTSYLPHAVLTIVVLHVLMATARMGFVPSLVAHAIPASIAVLGVAALSTQRFESMVSIAVALACAVAYGVMRPKAPRSRLGIGVFGLLSRLG